MTLNLERICLIIRVPRADERSTGPLAAEQIFQTLSLLHDEQLESRKRPGSISFEVLNVDRQIKFMVSLPKQYRAFLESQIYAHYPEAEIFEESDPLSGKHYLCSELLQLKAPIYPIKRYGQFEDRLSGTAVDPLSGITAVLAKLPEGQKQAGFQIILSPLESKWRQRYLKIIRNLRAGLFQKNENLRDFYVKVSCHPSPWVRLFFSPFFFLFRKKGVPENGRVKNELEEDAHTRLRDRESVLNATTDKVNKALYRVGIRLYTELNSAEQGALAKQKIKELAGSFKQFNSPALNGFAPAKLHLISGAELRKRLVTNDKQNVLNVEELATLFHLPNATVKTPNIDWVKSRKLEAPLNLPYPEVTPKENLTLIGKTNHRGSHHQFGIKCDPDRRRHVYIIGKTGMGKTTLIENMIYSDIQNGKGVGVIDPHGDLAERVLDFVPSHRLNDVVLFNPYDHDFPIAFNLMQSVSPTFDNIVASGLLGVFKKLYSHSWGPRLEHILRNTILSLLHAPNSTMLGIVRVLQDAQYRAKVVKHVKDPILRSFWENEFEVMNDKQRIEAISPILNKVGQFLSNPMIRNIVGQPQSKMDLRFAMDRGKIVIMNLSKGLIGEDNSSLLGAMLVTKFQLDAMSRADIPEAERRDFYLYVDEFQNFATDSFATILSEARKYRLNLTMANQYMAQMPDEVKDAVFGNVGSLISFQVGYDDAEYLSSQFREAVLANDLVGLNKYTIYGKILIDGMPSPAFSADTLPPPTGLNVDNEKREKIKKMSRERYAQSRAEVEEKIARWSDNKSR